MKGLRDLLKLVTGKRAEVSAAEKELADLKAREAELEAQIKKERAEVEAVEPDARKALEEQITSQRNGLKEANALLKAGNIDGAYHALKGSEPKSELELRLEPFKYGFMVEVADKEGKKVWNYHRIVHDAVLSDGVVYLVEDDRISGINAKDNKLLFEHRIDENKLWINIQLAKSGELLHYTTSYAVYGVDNKGQLVEKLACDCRPTALAANDSQIFIGSRFGNIEVWKEGKDMASTKIKEQSILGMCADNENLYVVSSNCFRANSVTCYDISGMKIKWQAKLKDMPYRITKEKGELKIFAVEDGCYCAPNYKRRTYTLDPATGNTLKVDKPANR